MADNTKIEWADATVNAINGCSVTSPGCTNCYAMKLAGTRLRNHPTRAGLTQDTKAGPIWTGEVRLNEAALLQPLAWKRPRRIFWNAHGDTFHDAVPDEWIDRIFAVAALTPQHTHMILTKRSSRMREYVTTLGTMIDAARVRRITLDDPHATFFAVTAPKAVGLWPLPNVWLGVSVEDQARADERIPNLLATPAAVRFLSCEPLLGPVCIDRWLNIMWRCSYCREFFSGRHKQHCPGCGKEGGFCGSHPFNGRNRPARRGFPFQSGSGIDWVIVGGENGPRPMHPDWARSLRDQCAAAGVPFHFKQWGKFMPAEAVANDSGGVDFVPPLPMTGLLRWQRWDGNAYRSARADESVNEFFEPGILAVPVGKRVAGRLLDGVQHDGMPEVRP